MSANSLMPTSLHYLFHSIKLAKKEPDYTAGTSGLEAAAGGHAAGQVRGGGNQAGEEEREWLEIGLKRVIVIDLNPAGLSFITDYYFDPGHDVLNFQLEFWGQTMELMGEVKACTPMNGLYQYELIFFDPCTFKRQLRDLLAKVMTYYEDDPRYPAFHEWALQLITGKHPEETERNHGRT